MFFPINPPPFQETWMAEPVFGTRINIVFNLAENTSIKKVVLICSPIITIIPSVSTPPLLYDPIPIFLCRRLEGAAASTGDQVKGVCDGGGGEGEESHDLCAPAGGSLQHTTGLLPPAKARRGLQSGSRWPHWVHKHSLEIHLSYCTGRGWSCSPFSCLKSAKMLECKCTLYSQTIHKYLIVSTNHFLTSASWAVKYCVIL